jgi:Spy/CpxP family protein refolding chaperone
VSPLNPRRMRLAGMALLAVTFVVGMLAGTAFGRVLNAGEPAPGTATATECRGEQRGPHHILDELELSAEQRTRIDGIMARGRVRTDSLWKSDGARIRAAVDSTRAEIRALLTPAQAAEYDALRQKHEERKRRERAERDSAAARRTPPAAR